MAAVYVVYPNVDLGPGSEIGEFVIIGLPQQPKVDEMRTRIGSNAIIRSHTVIYAGNVIGANFKTGHGVTIRELNEIGDDVSIIAYIIRNIEHHVKICNGVRIHSNVFVPEYSVLEDGAWVGPNVVFTNARYPQSPCTKAKLKGAHVLAGEDRRQCHSPARRSDWTQCIGWCRFRGGP